MFSDEVIRPTVRAVIRKGPLVIVQVKQSVNGVRYLTLPGGRQEFGESMHDCLKRECLEEIGIVPDIGDLLHVADVVRISEEKTRHLSEVLFAASVPDSYSPRLGASPDKRQTDTIWADPARDGGDFLPRYDIPLARGAADIYLGRLRCETP